MPAPNIPPDLKQLYDRNQAMIRDHVLDGCPHVIVELIERIGRDEAPVSDEEWSAAKWSECTSRARADAVIAARSKS